MIVERPKRRFSPFTVSFLSRAACQIPLIALLLFSLACEVTYTSSLPGLSPRIGDVKLTKIETVNSETMEIVDGADGSVWVVTKYEVLKFPKGDLEKRKVIIDPQIFQQRFGKSMGAFSSADLASDGVLWVGTWKGQIFRFHRGQWGNYVTEEIAFGGKVSGIALNETADVLWMGARDALWEAVKKGNTLDFVIEDRIEDIALGADGSIAAVTYDKVYRYTRDEETEKAAVNGSAEDGSADGKAQVLWALGEDAKKWISSVTPYRAGWLVGTQDGFFQLSPSGEIGAKELEGEWIMTALEHPEGLIVGSWQNGLFFESESGWLRLSSDDGLPGDSVMTLHLDTQERLWIGLYDGGTLVADLAALRQEAEKVGPVR